MRAIGPNSKKSILCRQRAPPMAVHRRSLPLALSGFLFLVVDLHRPHAHRIRFLIRFDTFSSRTARSSCSSQRCAFRRAKAQGCSAHTRGAGKQEHTKAGTHRFDMITSMSALRPLCRAQLRLIRRALTGAPLCEFAGLRTVTQNRDSESQASHVRLRRV